MAVPNHGDPIIDSEAEKLLRELRKWGEAYFRNLSLPLIKKLLKALKIATAHADDAALTKIQQTIGGVKSVRRKGR